MAPASDATKREVSLAGKQPKELVHDRDAKMCTASQRKKLDIAFMSTRRRPGYTNLSTDIATAASEQRMKSPETEKGQAGRESLPRGITQQKVKSARRSVIPFVT